MARLDLVSCGPRAHSDKRSLQPECFPHLEPQPWLKDALTAQRTTCMPTGCFWHRDTVCIAIGRHSQTRTVVELDHAGEVTAMA